MTKKNEFLEDFHEISLVGSLKRCKHALSRDERGTPTRKDNAARIVSHELETLRFVSLLLPLCVSVPKLYSVSREA